MCALAVLTPVWPSVARHLASSEPAKLAVTEQALEWDVRKYVTKLDAKQNNQIYVRESAIASLGRRSNIAQIRGRHVGCCLLRLGSRLDPQPTSGTKHDRV